MNFFVKAKEITDDKVVERGSFDILEIEEVDTIYEKIKNSDVIKYLKKREKKNK